ncbi:hypothetical protein [Actinokineospora diospyrosa]|uniref:Excreted virulence factor EspC (Type VII ESX diderm) n=1 Tax=Actinokineospora diospyrosa TaxID=103728 RepID=A0ABT1IKM5_9PSEU|nr:hypothetical protein [Actinokineospora diospyrosa]MCP2273204.1 Protein of unknown function (DUF2580) [Actinokineospora diospyrosa]
MPEEFEVDLDEVDRLAGSTAALADEVRGDVAWKYGVDGEQWPAGDPIGAAVVVYLRSLRAAKDRLCGGLDDISVTLSDTAAAYRAADERVWRAVRDVDH